MNKIYEKIVKFWMFKVRNSVQWKGERGGFKAVFRKYDMEISSVSGNFRIYRSADMHPFMYLAKSVEQGNVDNVWGFVYTMYALSSLLTTDQKFADDIAAAVDRYSDRLEGKADVSDDAEEEKISIEEVRQVQEVVEMPKKERRKYERDVNGRFKKVVKKANGHA